MVLNNPWQNITNKDIAFFFYFSETSLNDTGSITLTINFQLRDTSTYFLPLKIQKSS